MSRKNEPQLFVKTPTEPPLKLDLTRNWLSTHHQSTPPTIVDGCHLGGRWKWIAVLTFRFHNFFLCHIFSQRMAPWIKKHIQQNLFIGPNNLWLGEATLFLYETRPLSDSEAATMYKLKGQSFLICELAKASSIENWSILERKEKTKTSWGWAVPSSDQLGLATSLLLCS